MDLLTRFVGIMMVFFIYIAVDVEGAAYDGTCTGTGAGDCTETNNICDSTSNKCACSTTSYRKGGTECATKILLKAACTASQPDDQCADALAECASGLTCVCKSGNFENKDGKCSTQVPFKTNCDVAETARDQCVADTECKDDGTGTHKCLCKTTHYEHSGACKPRKSPKVTCASGECVTHATCDSGTSKCVCNAGYSPSPTISPTMCSGVVKVITLPYMYMVPILVSLTFLL